VVAPKGDVCMAFGGLFTTVEGCAEKDGWRTDGAGGATRMGTGMRSGLALVARFEAGGRVVEASPASPKERSRFAIASVTRLPASSSTTRCIPWAAVPTSS
jgi:hypothetical protein